MNDSLNTIYNLIKYHAHAREVYYNSFRSTNRPDADSMWNIHNHIVTACVTEYRSRGGKRQVEKHLAQDR